MKRTQDQQRTEPDAPDEFPGSSGLAMFSAPPFDHLEDLCGDIVGADLVCFLAGNQFMVAEDLFSAFRESVRDSGRELGGIFYETLPPGVLVDQIRRGGLQMGSLRLCIQPDVLAASPASLKQLAEDGIVGDFVEYASNELAILVPKGNPKRISGLADLARDGIRVALPHPGTEGVGRLVMAALQAAGGQALLTRMTEEKAANGEVLTNQIHHRESPAWIMEGVVDAALAWRTEAIFHQRQGRPIEAVEIAPEHNQRGRYAVAPVANAPHPTMAKEFIGFMSGPAARSAYARHGFLAP